MRSTACGLLTLALLAGCGGKYAPKSAVLTGWDRTRAFAEDAPSTVQYSGHALVAAPVIPVLPFGQGYDLSIVVAAKKVGISQFQFARTAGPEGIRWIAIETSESTGEQTIISNVETLDAWAPEIPARRKVDPTFKVVDRSTNDELEIVISYENADNEQVEATLQGNPPSRYEKKRSQDNLGAMRQSAFLLIDVPHNESLFKAKIKVNGRGVTVAKAAGIVPLQMSTEQTMGGIATGQFVTVSGETRPLESSWPAPRIIRPEAEEVEAPAPAPAPAPAADPLKDAMQAGFDELQACYTAAAVAKPDLEGRILLSWKVAEGKASDVAVVLDTAGDEGLATCISEKVAAWTYAEGISGDVGFPITIVKGEGVRLSEEAPAGAEDGPKTAPRTPPADNEAPAEEGGPKTAPRTPPADKEAPAEEGGPKTAPRTPPGEDEAAESADKDELSDGDDLLGDDPDAMTAPRPKGVVYNGLADFTSAHVMRDGNTVELDWKTERAGDRVYVRQISPERTLQYEYLVNYDSLELTDVSVFQVGRPIPVVHIDINPAIPDLRRPFSGRAESNYVIDLNGQDGYAYGKVEAWWSEGGPRVKFIPSEPDWTNDGALVTTIVFRQGGSDISVQKTGEK